ncbi:MAG: hypothetical protein GXO14_01265 [Thermococci archaeon]|nr:hypothetical protein [Thermococci archaeon]
MMGVEVLSDAEEEVLRRLATRALKDLDEAYRRMPDTNNGKTYLWRGRERVRMMLAMIMKGGKEDAV